jgi:hypothetical protein
MNIPDYDYAYLATGGRRMRDVVEMKNSNQAIFWEHGLFVARLYLSGHSMDAPDWMPSGSMNSTEWCGGNGQPHIKAGEVRRAA